MGSSWMGGHIKSSKIGTWMGDQMNGRVWKHKCVISAETLV